MASEIIQAKYDELEAIARQFGQRAQTIGELRNQFQRAAQPLEQGGWRGRGSEAFFRELNGQIYPAMQRLRLALDEARAVTLEASEIMRRAEQEAAAPFRGEAGANGAKGGPAAFAGARAAASGSSKSGGFWGGVGDFFGGMWDETKDMVSGIKNLVLHPIETAKGLAYAVTHPGEFWDAIKKPYVDAWESGHPWQAVGRGTMFALSFALGAKGTDKVAKAAGAAGKAGRAGDVAGTAGRAGEAAGAMGKGARAADTASDATRAAQNLDRAADVADGAGAARAPSTASRVQDGTPAATSRLRGEGAFPLDDTLPYQPKGNKFGQYNDSSCVAASCRILLDDPAIPEAYIRQAAQVTEAGGYLRDAPAALEQFGLKTSYRDAMSLDELQAATNRGPAIAGIRAETTGGYHALVVDGFEQGYVLIRDPWPPGGGSAYKLPLEAFEKAWQNKAVVVQP